jgi:hypothetical protein
MEWRVGPDHNIERAFIRAISTGSDEGPAPQYVYYDNFLWSSVHSTELVR